MLGIAPNGASPAVPRREDEAKVASASRWGVNVTFPFVVAIGDNWSECRLVDTSIVRYVLFCSSGASGSCIMYIYMHSRLRRVASCHVDVMSSCTSRWTWSRSRFLCRLMASVAAVVGHPGWRSIFSSLERPNNPTTEMQSLDAQLLLQKADE